MQKQRGSFSVQLLLWGLLAMVVITGLARWMSQGGLSATGKVQISFWNGFTGPDGIVMLAIIEEFNRQNPDITVRMQRIPWATYYNKLTVAGSDGRGPQVFISHADAMSRIQRAGFLGELTDLYDSTGLDPADFDPSVLEQVRFGDRMLGVPLDIHPQGMYVNRDMLTAAGYTDPPQNRAEFLDFMRKATIESSGNLDQKQWGFALTFWGNNYRTLIPQFGGRYLDEQGNSALNSLENLRALEFIERLAKDGSIPPPDNGLGWFGYRTKRVAMVWDGVYMLGDLMRLNDLDYVGAPIPVLGDKPGTLANSHILCIKRTLSDRELSAAKRFIQFLSDHSLDWAAAGQVPARRSIRAEPEFNKLQVQSAFAEQVPHMLFPPRSPVIFELMLEVDQAVERVVRGQATSKESLEIAHQNAQKVIERDRKEHPGGVTL